MIFDRGVTKRHKKKNLGGQATLVRWLGDFALAKECTETSR